CGELSILVQLVLIECKVVTRREEEEEGSLKLLIEGLSLGKELGGKKDRFHLIEIVFLNNFRGLGRTECKVVTRREEEEEGSLKLLIACLNLGEEFGGKKDG
ncbi:hypothetical protein HAX54_025907, partial [Datura stramonium]|nr:hypothetical protein [Datura stramonium]